MIDCSKNIKTEAIMNSFDDNNSHNMHSNINSSQNKIGDHHVSVNNKTGKVEFFDTAMKELLNICTDFDKEFSLEKENPVISLKKLNQYKEQDGFPSPRHYSTPIKQVLDPAKRNFRAIDDKLLQQIPNCIQVYEDDEFIEGLQEKQATLQAQLDQLLESTRMLDSKLRQIEVASLQRQQEPLDSLDEEDEELIEFQRIENELRMSEINRQLNSIQDELTLRLYNRLPAARLMEDENIGSSPASSSSSALSYRSTNCIVDGNVRESTNDNDKKLSNSASDQSDEKISSKHQTSLNTTNSDIESIVDQMFEYECLSPTVSKESVGSSKNGNSSEVYTQVSDSCNPVQSFPSAIVNNPIKQHDQITSSASANTPNYISTSNSGLRNNSANSDLERIEEDEDEEEVQDYYCDSDRYRNIYQEKLSHLICGATMKNGTFVKFDQSSVVENSSFDTKIELNQQTYENQKQLVAGKDKSVGPAVVEKEAENNKEVVMKDESNISKSKANDKTVNNYGNSFKRSTSRPLTLYLPKPDEHINLRDHIQVLGHDLSLISSNIKLTQTSACGYLRKLSTSKRWNTRYFYFNRSQKSLAYFKDEKDMLKGFTKQIIHFSDINDVYVDHKMSGIGLNKRSSKKNYIFVLVTVTKKFFLGSPLAEIMRAWIDIIYTAAQGTDYSVEITTTE